jgi:hypothetical protein
MTANAARIRQIKAKTAINNETMRILLSKNSFNKAFRLVCVNEFQCAARVDARLIGRDS